METEEIKNKLDDLFVKLDRSLYSPFGVYNIITDIKHYISLLTEKLKLIEDSAKNDRIK